MSSAAVLDRPQHGALSRPGAKRQVVRVDLPPWHFWRGTGQEWRRSVRWIEGTLVQPVGVGAGRPMRVAKFQKDLLRRLYGSLAAMVSIAAGNGKTTFMAAVALERLCRGDDYVEVDVLATKEGQARRLVERAIQMIECSPQLANLFEFYKDAGELAYRPSGSKMRAHPASLPAVQGLNSDLALIDEIGMVPPELAASMIARLGKKPGQRVVGFGTPGYAPDNMLERLRGMYHAGELPPGVEFVEYAADPGCDIHDEAQWRKANPAIEAGFLDEASMMLKATLLTEFEFRAYHLGQPVESSGPWLPPGAWQACAWADHPPEGTPVVLALWGNYRRQAALVGCTLDGSLFLGAQWDGAQDDLVADRVRRAADRWQVVELVGKPFLRGALMMQLGDEGIPVAQWPSDVATDVESSAAFYQAIAEQTVAHDHDDLLAEHVAGLSAKVDRNGNPRLVESSDVDVSAALAARAAWWRARALAEQEPTAELAIY